jgi:hypothetical protein
MPPCGVLPLVRWVCAWRLLHRRCCPIPAAWIRTASSLSRPPRGERPLSAHGYVSVCLQFPLRAAKRRDRRVLFLSETRPFRRDGGSGGPDEGRTVRPDTFRDPRGFFTRPGFSCGWETVPCGGTMQSSDGTERDCGTATKARRASTADDPLRAFAGTPHPGTRGVRFGVPSRLPKGRRRHQLEAGRRAASAAMCRRNGR